MRQQRCSNELPAMTELFIVQGAGKFIGRSEILHGGEPSLSIVQRAVCHLNSGLSQDPAALEVLEPVGVHGIEDFGDILQDIPGHALAPSRIKAVARAEFMA